MEIYKYILDNSYLTIYINYDLMNRNITSTIPIIKECNISPTLLDSITSKKNILKIEHVNTILNSIKTYKVKPNIKYYKKSNTLIYNDDKFNVKDLSLDVYLINQYGKISTTSHIYFYDIKKYDEQNIKISISEAKEIIKMFLGINKFI